MGRPNRAKRGPHRDPTSLAVETFHIAPEVDNNSQIDPALLDIEPPPQPPPWPPLQISNQNPSITSTLTLIIPYGTRNSQSCN